MPERDLFDLDAVAVSATKALQRDLPGLPSLKEGNGTSTAADWRAKPLTVEGPIEFSAARARTADEKLRVVTLTAWVAPVTVTVKGADVDGA